MRICLVCDGKLPAQRYGGTERVVWGLGKALARRGDEVTLMAAKGSECPFGRLVEIDPSAPLSQQIPHDVDIIHFQNYVPADVIKESAAGRIPPYVVTIHGNHPDCMFPESEITGEAATRLSTPSHDPYAIYVSANHAERHGATAFVHNGLDWEDYPAFQPGLKREGLFFLGNAAWRVKNLKGAIDIAREAGERLHVLGGHRLNLKMGFRFTLSPKVRFHGMVDNRKKAEIANTSKGLIFPVRWHEPFGLAVVESLYYGAPVFATPYGSLPELVKPGTGFLSADPSELTHALKELASDEKRLHEYAAETFNADVMARKYRMYYEMRLNGERINL